MQNRHQTQRSAWLWLAIPVLLIGTGGCGGGGGGGDSPEVQAEVYRVDVARTFDLHDLDGAEPGAEREALARANAQATALGNDPDFRLELQPGGGFTLHLSAKESATGTWGRTGSVIRMETTQMAGAPVTGIGTTDATVVEDGLLRIDAEGIAVYLRRDS